MTTPTDNLLRIVGRDNPCELRSATDGGGRIMHGHFAVYNQWTEIDSRHEGRFMERVAPGAFDDAIASTGDQLRVLFHHGKDPQVGTKPLGTPDLIRSDNTGYYYEVGLFNTNYVNELVPAIEAGQMGASFRFGIPKGGDVWENPRRPSASNPDMLPERTLVKGGLYEFGPTPFGAYHGATAGMRSMTDDFIDWFDDPTFVARFTERVGLKVVEHILAQLPADGRSNENPAPDGPTDIRRTSIAEARTQLLKLKRSA